MKAKATDGGCGRGMKRRIAVAEAIVGLLLLEPDSDNSYVSVGVDV